LGDALLLDLGHYANRHSWRTKFARAVWNVVWLFLFRPTPRGVLHGWRRFLLRCFGARIGRGVNVLPSCRIWQPWKLTMGDYSCLSERVDCYSVDQITIGAQVVVSQGVFLCCASHDISSPIMELTYRPITIMPQAWIASRAFVGPGVTVGEGAVVGACAVVTKDVEPWTVVAGNPARVVKKRVIRGTEDGRSSSRQSAVSSPQ
jgi:putative colanic acid biosynthesis acetyltransferase WcaF